MQIDRLDHLVLTVRDIDASIDFYTRVLGMRAVTFGAGRKALAFGAQKINLHQAGGEFEPKAERPTPGSADLCFIVATPPRRWPSNCASRPWKSSRARCRAPAPAGRSSRCTCATPT